MKIIANILLAGLLWFAGILACFKIIDFFGLGEFSNLWARFYGNGNFIPWEINIQYVIDWVAYYWDVWICTSIAIGFVFFVLYLVFSYRLSQFKRKKKEHLENKNSYNSLLDKGVKKDYGIFSGKFGSNEFYVSYQDRGLVVGPPGTGKTAFLINQILKVADNGISFIASDIKPEIHAVIHKELENRGFDVALLNPLSNVGHSYNPLDDIISESEINEMVVNLLPLPPKSEPAWVKAQRKYLRLALEYLYHTEGRNCSLPESYAMFAEYSSPQTFLSQIAGVEHPMVRASALKLMSELDSSKPAQAGYSEVFDELHWLSYPEIYKTLSRSDFSINDLGKDKPIALFLQFDETKLKTLGSLLSLLYGHILNVLIRYVERKPVALFFDEIGNLPLIEGLAEKLHTIRSRYLPTWMYWQTVAQMDKYSTNGKNGSEIILSSSDLQMFFRSNSRDTRDLVSALVGTTMIAVESRSKGKRKDVWELFDTTATHNVTYSERRENVIEPHEIGELEQYEAITLYRGGKSLGVGQPYFMDYKEYFDSKKARG